MDRPSLAEAFFAADLSTDTPTHDLHGKHIGEALAELEHLVTREIHIGGDAVRLIHGQGTGALRIAIHAWLSREQRRGRIRAFRDTQDLRRAGGVTIVLLTRKEVP